MTQEEIDRQEVSREIRYARLRFEDAMDTLRALLIYGKKGDDYALQWAVEEAGALGRIVGVLYREIQEHGITGFDAIGDIEALRNSIMEYRTTLAVAFSDVRVEPAP